LCERGKPREGIVVEGERGTISRAVGGLAKEVRGDALEPIVV